jgi:hypothetical protein
MVADCGFAPWVNQYHSLLWYRWGSNTAIKRVITWHKVLSTRWVKRLACSWHGWPN